MDLSQISTYWNGRAQTYHESIQAEHDSGIDNAWKSLINEYIDSYVAVSDLNHDHAKLRILDIGTGPGFFPALLASPSREIDAIDVSEAMVAQAELHTRQIHPPSAVVRFHVMDAQALLFEDDTFDVIITRNVTWTLPEPAQAYAEWVRVLKPGGIFLNFDANWYGYLQEENHADAHLIPFSAQSTRVSSYEPQRGDASADQCSACENIARNLPLTYKRRPLWDQTVLSKAGFDWVHTHENIGELLWTADQQERFKETPLFMIAAGVKQG